MQFVASCIYIYHIINQLMIFGMNTLMRQTRSFTSTRAIVVYNSKSILHTSAVVAKRLAA